MLTGFEVNNDRPSLLESLIRYPGVPDDARNRLWENVTLEGWNPAKDQLIPPPVGDGVETAAEISKGDMGVALGASLPANDLHVAVTGTPLAKLWEGAALNPGLRDDTRRHMEGHEFGDGLFASRDAAQKQLAEFDARRGDDPADVAAALIDAGCGHTVASIVASRAHGTADVDTDAVADAALTLLGDATSGPTRRMRAWLVGSIDRGIVNAVVDAVLASERGVIDQWVFPHVEDRVISGTLDVDDIARPYDAVCVTWAQITDSPLAVTVEEAQVQQRRVKPKHPGFRRQTLDMNDALDLIGLGNAGRRLALNSSSGLTPEDQRRLVETADVETVLDWAEGSMTHRPTPDEVYDAVTGQGKDRLYEIGAEARRRKGHVSPDLLCALPGMANEPMSPAAARRAWFLLSETLEGDPAAWDIMVGLLANGWDASIIELAEACSVAALNPA